MTVFLVHPTRFSFVLLVAMTSVLAPMHLVAYGRSIPPGPQMQTAPKKPSADVPLPASLPPTQPTEASEAAAKPAQQQLNVEFTDGKVTVDATNASLDGVLKDVAAKAGIRITGSVSDERVFGHYGPASPSVILATLLDGTSSNMLLVDDDAKGGSELILTPRAGGPTPPNPNNAALERANEQQDDRSASRFGPPNRSFQPGQGRGPLTVPPNIGSQFQVGARPGSQPDADSIDPAQPANDSRTPQQIYDQLQNQNQQKSPPQPPQ